MDREEREAEDREVFLFSPQQDITTRRVKQIAFQDYENFWEGGAGAGRENLATEEVELVGVVDRRGDSSQQLVVPGQAAPSLATAVSLTAGTALLLCFLTGAGLAVWRARAGRGGARLGDSWSVYSGSSSQPSLASSASTSLSRDNFLSSLEF